MVEIMIQTLQTTIDTLYRDYANYTITSRAIPSLIDGLKPVQRKILFNAFKYGYNRKIKVIDISAISSIGYKHGETSAQNATVLMTADYNNNLPLFIGHGAFGTRQIPESASARYIYVELSKTNYNLFTDFDTLIYDLQDKTNLEPNYYLPILPLVLINGIKGIAVGFATNILPYSVDDISTITKHYYKGNIKKAHTFIKELLPSFPFFKGNIVKESEGKFVISGLVEKIEPKRSNATKTEYLITELPVYTSRDDYYKTLQKLIETNKIVDFIDECADTFKFRVIVNSVDCEKIDKDPLEYFKLRVTLTENLTVIDEHGKLKEYTNKQDLLDDWFTFREQQTTKQIGIDIATIQEQITLLELKLQFIKAIVNKEIDIYQSNEQTLLDYLDNKNKNVTLQEKKTIINSPLYTLTHKEIEKLQTRIDEQKDVLKTLQQTTAKQRLLNDLEKFK